VQTTGRSRRLADDGRHFIDPAVRFARIFVGIVNAAPVVIFSVAQHDGAAEAPDDDRTVGVSRDGLGGEAAGTGVVVDPADELGDAGVGVSGS